MAGSVTNQGNDCVQTPDSLALAVVKHFNPTGNCLEPCSGKGSFVRAFSSVDIFCDSYEILDGKDFLTANITIDYDWVITNPPFSKIRQFLEKCCKAKIKNIVFLIYLTAISTSNRLNILRKNHYNLEEICFVKNKERLFKSYGWNQSGFELAALHFKFGKTFGVTKVSYLDW